MGHWSSIKFFRRFYLLIAAATAVASMVITGSLVVGDSVRETLLNGVDARLCGARTVITSSSGYFSDQMGLEFNPTRLIGIDGFVSNYGRMLPVRIWGVDSVVRGMAAINQALSDQVTDPEVVVRLQRKTAIPSGSLFVSKNYTTSLRLSVSSRTAPDLNLKTQQSIPLNLFVNRAELAQAIDIPGDQANTLLFASDSVSLGSIWDPTLAGYSIKNGEISYSGIFIPQAVTALFPEANRLFSYLVNSISVVAPPLAVVAPPHDVASREYSRELPYSFVTAIDSFNSQPLDANQAIISDYTARRLNIAVGDSVMMKYYVTTRLKELAQDSIPLKVAAVVPLEEFARDSTLSAQFPGLTSVERCTDWDSDLPIDMSKIERIDEDYWDQYGATPKMLVSYQTISPRWSNPWGNATALRSRASDADTAEYNTPGNGLEMITPTLAGITESHPYHQARRAASGGVDFASLFLSLAFFIVISALLLAVAPLGAMVELRKSEIELYSAMGYTRRRIRDLFFREAILILTVAVAVGAVMGIGYTWVVLRMLEGVWNSAVHTSMNFIISLQWKSIMVGALATLVTMALVIILTINNILKKLDDAPKSCISIRFGRLNLLNPWIATAFAIIIIGLLVVDQPIPSSLIMLIGLIITFDSYITRQSRQSRLFANLAYNRHWVMRTVWSLSLAVYVVFLVGFNRPSFDHSSPYSLWGESSVPIYHNLSQQALHKKLGLENLPRTTKIEQLLRYDGDEASCLNLNRVRTPSILSISSLDSTMRHRTPEGYIPAAVDGSVLTWSLARAPGDTLHYSPGIILRFDKILNNTIFQGHLLMDETLFTECFPEESGSRVMLVTAPEDSVAMVREILERALSEYGIRLESSAERLAAFNSVTDTYLTIFLMLGGLGLILGVAAVVLMVARNLAARQTEIILMRHLGFTTERIGRLFYIENIIPQLFAIICGFITALLAATPWLANVSLELWVVVTLFLTVLIVGSIIFTRSRWQKNEL